ncbi:MAG: GNAT family N-acetyltransferase [Clostridium sp.]|uniref:GNAT family N-acetyltransferase n=1 Tax=Clostridium sp. TaxID=1506 RepID=UPI00301EAF0E
MKNNNEFLKIKGDLVYIKEPEYEELDYVEKLWGDVKTTGEIGGPFKLKDRDGFFERMVSPGDGLNKYFLIYNKSSLPVGEISFRKSNIDYKKATFNVKLEWQHRGNGYAKEALDLILDYYFNQYGGEVMEDDIAINNINAQKIFLKYGFEHVTNNEDIFLVRMTKEKFNIIKSEMN